MGADVAEAAELAKILIDQLRRGDWPTTTGGG